MPTEEEERATAIKEITEHLRDSPEDMADVMTLVNDMLELLGQQRHRSLLARQLVYGVLTMFGDRLMKMIEQMEPGILAEAEAELKETIEQTQWPDEIVEEEDA